MTDILTVPRDSYGRPLILQANGKAKGYTRISGLAKTLDTADGLMLWSNAMTVIGMARSVDLADIAYSLTRGDDPYTENKSDLIKLAKAAQELAGSTVKRDLGTTLHYWSEVVDRTGDLDSVPDEFRADIESYLWATVEMETVAAELFVVVDELEAAGTLDALKRLPDGRVVVTDTKTGQRDHCYPMSVEVQVATYAHGQRYDFETGERTPLHPDLDMTEGLLIHLPSGTATCELYALDLRRGWQNAVLACDVRKARKDSGRKLRPYTMRDAA